MIKKFKETKERVGAAISVYKDMYKAKAYLDKICDALYALPDEVDYAGVQEHAIEKIAEYERKYDVRYSHPFVLPSNEAEDDQVTIDDIETE